MRRQERQRDVASYPALQSADLELGERLAGLVAVADILESLGGILAGDVEQDLLTTTVGEKASTISTCCVVREAGAGEPRNGR